MTIGKLSFCYVAHLCNNDITKKIVIFKLLAKKERKHKEKKRKHIKEFIFICCVLIVFQD